MAATFVQERVLELGEHEIRQLKGMYCQLRELKAAVDGMHHSYVRKAVPPEFAVVESVHLMVDALFLELERFIVPICDPVSAREPVEQDDTETICPI